jgi:hypothetical protein
MAFIPHARGDALAVAGPIVGIPVVGSPAIRALRKWLGRKDSNLRMADPEFSFLSRPPKIASFEFRYTD